MEGVTSFHLKPSSPSISPAARTKPAKHSCPSSSPSSSSLHSLSLLLSQRPTSRTRLSPVTVSPVARYGRGGGGYRPSPRPGNSRRSPGGARFPDPDDDALELSKITSTSVRLIDEQQNMIGVVSKSEAIQMAEDAERDLVILSVDADPPVLRIMDYNKYKYEQQKKKRDQQKKSAASRMDMKELKMGYNIDSHDYSVRLKAAQKFLKEGDKVKIIVNLKGRENEFRNIAIQLIKRFQNDIGELATEESKSFSDKNIFIVLLPNKTVLQKAQEQPKKKEQPATEVSASVF